MTNLISYFFSTYVITGYKYTHIWQSSHHGNILSSVVCHTKITISETSTNRHYFDIGE